MASRAGTRGCPVPDVFSVPIQPNRVSAPADTLRRSLWAMASPMGPEFRETPAATPTLEFRFQFLLDSRALVRQLEAWYDGVFGACRTCWLPSYQHDLVPATDMAAGSDMLVIRRIGYTDRLFPVLARRHLAFLTFAGVLTHRVVTAVVDDGPGAGTETLTLDGTVPTAFPADRTGGMISVLRLVRLAEDPLDVAHHRAGLAECELAFRERPQEVLA